MNTTRIQYLITGGVLAASAILGAPTALAQPDSPIDPSCAAQPGNGVCASGPWGLDGTGANGGIAGMGGDGMGGGMGGAPTGMGGGMGDF